MNSSATLTDRYPTRLPEAGAVMDRPDPVVWPGRDGPWDDEAVNFFGDNGYRTVEDVLDTPDLAQVRSEIDRLATELGDDERLIRESSNGDVRSIFSVHTLSTEIARIIARDDVAGVARQLLGDDVYVHQSRVNLKPGFAGGPFYWHSDFETWHAEDGMPTPRAVSVSLALTPNTRFNGPLMILPGSHRRFVPCVGETPGDYHRESLKSYRPPFGTPEESDIAAMAQQYGITQVTGGAGSALYFDCNCLHASAGNISPFPRSNLFVVFNAVSNALEEPFAARSRRPDYLAAR
ncbi:Ectoine dioxygenase OS=Tsukamurella paurometabola (strain ATCC 8368 / DSM / CCUG 35730 / CIP 100753 / JCM 10117 / KCTC 9821 / NBRC 16120 / NCIMB 702349/ NCTC 13040) OX=521096 GN=Tpau_3672 PE=3 SV=1 [Tsukamurella paurometabola]|uniref:Ectoine hydroxylase n=1 Tax=Tsukamurella paurometabola (strain ATCC 8368 / DSM 20162 / CCUG 35730 / CIP 100753 / JCM 10117 / KCTC 9821 / NBRC 16120 / NCIMB 702349 / NCTC 13040) TaxID=521096 RepID=D5UY13_TSUPD|nr:ectoine hydroxylase [Tsukamurella paurometabola]ADG80250.1 ectoine hydroxylase [Tsukamurella paurometabola DSM 20162]SUP39009.1 ectoine hydroxylase [Tsukamurella paurometabola]